MSPQLIQGAGWEFVPLNERPAAETGIASPRAPVLPWALSVRVTYNKQGKSPKHLEEGLGYPTRPAAQSSWRAGQVWGTHPCLPHSASLESTPGQPLTLAQTGCLSLHGKENVVSPQVQPRNYCSICGGPTQKSVCQQGEEGGPARIPTGWRCVSPSSVPGDFGKQGSTREQPVGLGSGGTCAARGSRAVPALAFWDAGLSMGRGANPRGRTEPLSSTFCWLTFTSESCIAWAHLALCSGPGWILWLPIVFFMTTDGMWFINVVSSYFLKKELLLWRRNC